MSEQEIKLAIKKSNVPVIATIISCSLVVCGAFATGTSKVLDAVRDIRNNTEFRVEYKPKIDNVITDMAIVKNKLNIK